MLHLTAAFKFRKGFIQIGFGMSWKCHVPFTVAGNRVNNMFDLECATQSGRHHLQRLELTGP